MHQNAKLLLLFVAGKQILTKQKQGYMAHIGRSRPDRDEQGEAIGLDLTDCGVVVEGSKATGGGGCS